jgi:hypothetical protein
MIYGKGQRLNQVLLVLMNFLTTLLRFSRVLTQKMTRKGLQLGRLELNWSKYMMKH